MKSKCIGSSGAQLNSDQLSTSSTVTESLADVTFLHEREKLMAIYDTATVIIIVLTHSFPAPCRSREL